MHCDLVIFNHEVIAALHVMVNCIYANHIKIQSTTIGYTNGFSSFIKWFHSEIQRNMAVKLL